jgi:hypothetical protein
VRRQLFATAVSAALLLGVATPALAKPGNGLAKGHHKVAKPKPPKAPKAPKAGRINGGGVSANGVEFSIEAREGQPRKGHFNYTSADGSVKIRCKGVTFTRIAYVQPGAPGAEITDGDCRMGSGRAATPVALNASFFDHGATGDQTMIRVTRPDDTVVVDDSGVIREGNINVR